MRQAMLSVKVAGGSGLNIPIGSVRGVTPAKKRGQSLLKVLWSDKHGPGTKQKQQRSHHGIRTFSVLMEATMLTRKVEMLRSVG